jgi:Zn-dependent M28 family amino/carboxypeptidase
MKSNTIIIIIVTIIMITKITISTIIVTIIIITKIIIIIIIATIPIIITSSPQSSPPALSPYNISYSSKGWRPRRTIKFCSWGAEEAGLIGSTEWVEQNERALSTKAVTYINVDIAVDGNLTLQLSGSPLLKSPITKHVKEVKDPHGGNVYDQMVKAKGNFTYKNLGSGSDYASFYQFVGMFKFIITERVIQHK